MVGDILVVCLTSDSRFNWLHSIAIVVSTVNGTQINDFVRSTRGV